ncbi:MAG: transglutaminase domain-containing protein [Cyanobacteria bacterium P01_G01_bin.67]
MTAKSHAKFANKSNQKRKSGRRFIEAAIAISVLVTAGNMRNTFVRFQSQQLISVTSETFASNKFLPLEFGSTDVIRQQDFKEIDYLAQQLQYSGSSVSELANLLSQNAATESAKARIIYAWITQHITYDMTAFNNAIHHDIYPNVSPEKVLQDRTTICSGFSNLYYALASAMNLESVIVIGYARGATPVGDARFQEINHAWNAVKIDQGWYLLDATWGAGSIRNDKFVSEYKPYYFAIAPQEFINNHYPQDSGWQLLSSTLTRKEFDNLPIISDHFYNLNMEAISHQNYKIDARNRLEIKLRAPQEVVALANLKQNAQEFSIGTTLVSRHGENIVVNVAPPEVGTYDLTIYAKHQDDREHYGEIIKYKITANNAVTELPKTSAHFHHYQASLIEPLAADLEVNWSTYFNLIVPEAIDVQVVNTNTKQWTPLNGYGNYFAGNVDVQPGNTSIVAKFPGEEQYWQLVEYQAK